MSKQISMDLSTKVSCSMSQSNSSKDPTYMEEIEQSEESPNNIVEGNDVEADSTQKVCKRDYVQNPRKRTAPYWKDFEEYNDENGHGRAKCKFCKTTYACDSNRNGSKNVKYHAETCKENPANKGKGKQTQLVLDESTMKMKNWVFKPQDVREAVAEMIIVDEMPFRCVEKSGLKNAFHVACPSFKMPSRTTISRDCHVIYKKEREKLKEFLRVSSQRVCFTTDSWTSCQTESYMCLTAHFIDNDWILHKRILNFCPLYSHKGESIGRALDDCLGYWGLSDKILTLTVDNASANDTACAYLKDLLQERNCIGGGKYLHMRCMAHIINLFVGDGLNACVKSVDKVRAVVKYVRSSPSRLQSFREQVDKCKILCKSSLCLDVPTRWNSTYLMLNSALKFKSAFSRMGIPILGEHQLGPITSAEWKQVEDLTSFLREFYHLTNRVSGSLYVTSNYMIYHVLASVSAVNELLLSIDNSLQTVAVQMKRKLDKYWGCFEKMNPLMFVAAIFDPSLKFEGVKVALSGIFGHADLDKKEQAVKTFAYELFDEYRQVYAPSNNERESTIAKPTVVDDVDQNIAWINALTQKVTRETSNRQGLSRSEFDSYLLEVKGEHEEKDILMWWKLNGPRYPILARMARDILAIPISTVPSESAFSTGGRTIDQYRASLLPSTVQALICTQDWLRRTKRSKCEEEENLEEVESIKNDMETNYPEDLLDGTFFISS